MNENVKNTGRIALNRMPDADPKTLSEQALKSVMNYVDEAEQFDDLTMLCIEYFGKK